MVIAPNIQPAIKRYSIPLMGVGGSSGGLSNGANFLFTGGWVKATLIKKEKIIIQKQLLQAEDFQRNI